MGQEFARELHRDLRRCTLKKRQHADLQAFIIHDLGFRAGIHRPRNRADHAIGQKHPEECSDQRRADHTAQNLRRFGNRPHGLNHPQHRRHNPQGRHAVRHSLNGVAWVAVMGLNG